MHDDALIVLQAGITTILQRTSPVERETLAAATATLRPPSPAAQTVPVRDGTADVVAEPRSAIVLDVLDPFELREAVLTARWLETSRSSRPGLAHVGEALGLVEPAVHRADHALLRGDAARKERLQQGVAVDGRFHPRP